MEIFATVISILITLFAAFLIINQLSAQTPEFAQYGWLIFFAFLVGAVAFLRYGLFKR